MFDSFIRFSYIVVAVVTRTNMLALANMSDPKKVTNAIDKTQIKHANVNEL